MYPRFWRSIATTALSAMLRPWYAGRGCIICLHRVVLDEEISAFAENRALEITRTTLREILLWVQQRGLDPIALDAVPERLARPHRRKFVAFTFDDGYRDNLIHALPIFREFEIPFALNITTGFIFGSSAPWWYALENLLVARERFSFRWTGRTFDFRCSDQTSRDETFRAIAELIRAAGINEQRDLIEVLFPSETPELLGFAKSLMLSWRELRDLAGDRLVTIGAHGVAHHTLNRLSDADAWNEMALAKSQLEAQLGQEVRHLAFPFGGSNSVGRREFELAAKCGFVTAVTTRSGNLFAEHARHLHSLPRLGLSGNYQMPATRLRNLESGALTAVAHRGRRVVTE